MVCHDDQIGFISRDEAEGLAPAMDHGDRVEAHIDKLTGGTPDKSTTGVILQVTITPASLLEEG